MAHERLTQSRVTIECVLAKPRSFSNLPAFSDLTGRIISLKRQKNFRKTVNTQRKAEGRKNFVPRSLS